jgi:hypothetical protein
MDNVQISDGTPSAESNGSAGGMTQFQKAIQSPVKCDICGEIMHPMYGGGWDNDRIVCAARGCGAEIEYPTSTEVPNAEVTGR